MAGAQNYCLVTIFTPLKYIVHTITLLRFFVYTHVMRKIIITLLIFTFLIPITTNVSNASLVSDRKYRVEQRQENKQNIRLIKDLFKVHDKFANEHDLKNLEILYADNFINNDGFNKEAYFKSVETTWESCKDITYTTKIKTISVNGDYADVEVEETASGTILDKIFDQAPIAGEIHSKGQGIYHLVKINGKWYIKGETSLSDESSLLYGDARFMNIELQAPVQVSAGETYSILLKVDADQDTYMIGSIDHDLVTYPTNTPKNELRALSTSKTLERYIKANTDNINEYAMASIAVSKMKKLNSEHLRVYMTGIACVMKRVNVIPKNNLIKLEDEE